MLNFKLNYMNVKTGFTEKNLQNLCNNAGGVVQLNKRSKVYENVKPYIETLVKGGDCKILSENGSVIIFTCKKDFRIVIKATVQNTIAQSSNMLNGILKRLILLGDKERIVKIQGVLSRLEKI